MIKFLVILTLAWRSWRHFAELSTREGKAREKKEGEREKGGEHANVDSMVRLGASSEWAVTSYIGSAVGGHQLYCHGKPMPKSFDTYQQSATKIWKTKLEIGIETELHFRTFGVAVAILWYGDIGSGCCP